MFKHLFAWILALYACAVMAAIDVNKATATELTDIKGIGPTTAARIVEARNQGPFKSWEDLIARVKGIAPTTAGKFSEGGLTVNGQSFKPAPAAKSPANAPKQPQASDKKPEKS